MRRIVFARHGGPEVLELRESPDPEPAPGEVRVRVEAAGVNFADILGRMGLYPDAPPLPAVVGFETAGRIDAVGRGVSEDLVGLPVIALGGSGGYTDVLCVPEERVFARPTGMSAEEGAAMPVVYLTAYVALCVMGSLVPDQRVLVHNAGGGVGLAALDICRLKGATSYGTASSWKHETLRERGAAACIDYRSVDFEPEIERITAGEGVDLVLDPLGGDSWKKSYRCLRPTGRLVIFGMSRMVRGKSSGKLDALRTLFRVPWFALNPLRLLRDSRGIVGVNLQQIRENAEDARRWMSELLGWYEAGRLAPRIDRVFPLGEAADAHRYIQERQNLGKVLLAP
ncbi:MAG: synaptic vesicle VAT-1 family membrane protein [Gemmatimonadota bacterium]